MSDDSKAEIGRRLAEAIRRAGVSQNALARQIGVTSGGLSRWVTGAHQPPLETLAEICRLVGVSTDEVLGLQPPRRILDTGRLNARIERLDARIRGELEREIAALRAEVERLKG